MATLAIVEDLDVFKDSDSCARILQDNAEDQPLRARPKGLTMRP